jgi:ketosteroid isomerase-like protein
MTRTTPEVVELYNFVAWNKRDYDLARELFADSVVRHEVGGSHTLSREEAVKRIKGVSALFDHMRFELPVVVAGDDGEHVAIVYDTAMTTTEGNVVNSGSVEIFRVVDARITEVWNCGRHEGRWA